MDSAPQQPTVTGLADTRATSLDRLAGDTQATPASLRNILPGDEPQLVVCAFASSI